MPLPAPARSRGALAIISRLLGDWKKPNPMPQTASRQATSSCAGRAGRNSTSSRPHGHHRQAEPAEQSGRIAVRQPPGDRRHHHQRGRPGRDQHADLDRRQAADVLEVERQRDERDQLCARARRSRWRPTARTPGGGTDRPAASARRSVNCRCTKNQPTAMLTANSISTVAGALAAADAVQRGDEQAEGDRVQHRARADRTDGRRSGVRGRKR